MLGWTSWTSWLLGGLIALLAFLFWQDRKRYWEFRRQLNVDGPYSMPFLGTMPQFMKKGLFKLFEEYKERYGNVYSLYSTTSSPGLVVSDLDLIRDLMVKRFSDFPNRGAGRGIESAGEPWRSMLVNLRDDHWKHVRAQLSPTFSSGKLKKMAPILQTICQSLQDDLGKKAASGEMVELKNLSQLVSMDLIAGVAFGVETDAIHNPDDQFMVNAKAFETTRPLALALFFLFPSLTFFFQRIGLGFVPKKSESFFLELTDVTFQQRKMDDKKHSDFIQLMLEAEKEGESQAEVDEEIDHRQELTTSAHWTRKGLVYDEIRANAMLFILAGFGTVSTVMSFTLFLLANHPECLKKAQAEVDKKLGKKQVTYETANELTYLEMCVNESMRLYPPGFLLSRTAHEDIEFGGMMLKKGMSVIVPVHVIHTDPLIWPDPMTFDPERHTPEARAARHPFAFLPFGMGPRNCIGMRLAQIELRMALASVLQRFSIVSRPNCPNCA